MAVISVFDGPVIWVLLCFICPAATVSLIFMSIRKTPPQNNATHMANPQAPHSNGHADHQVSRNGTMLGTHTEAHLRQLLASGHYHPTDFYWKPGMANWAPLSSLLAQAPGNAAPQPSQNHPGQRVAIKGTVINFNIQSGAGLISGFNGVRYNFVTANWGSPTVPPSVGLQVEFEANGPDATHVFPAQGHAVGASSGDFYRSSDNVIVSGVCAGLAHKWNTDPVLIRIAMVFIPFGWIFYLIGSMSWTARPTRGTSP
jgi:phage shock protein PspC (stress-responsive transcriptional regulator)